MGLAQVRVAAGPVLGTFRAAVWGRESEDAHEAVPLEPNALPVVGQGAVLERAQALPVGVDPPVTFEPGEPGPARGPHLLKIGQAGVSAVEEDAAWGKAPLLGGAQQVLEMVVLGSASVVLSKSR